MVARPAFPTRSVNSGEFSPEAEGRIDVKQYYSGARRMKGIEPVPQSGFRRMGGTRHVMKARRSLVPLVLTGAAVVPGPHSGTQIVWSANCSGIISALHIEDFAVSAGAAAFAAEYFNGALWLPIGPAFGPWTTAADRMAAFAPQRGRQASQLRIRATFSAPATVSIGAVSAWSESGAPLAARFVTLTRDDGVTYAGFVSGGICDFCTWDGGFSGSAALPLLSDAMLADLDFYAEVDTIGLFHPSNVPTQRILNFGAGHEWGVDAWPYAPIPDVDLGGTYVKTADVWEIILNWEPSVEMFLVLTVEGEQTPGIPFDDSVTGLPIAVSASDALDWAAFAVSVQAALEALPSVGTGVTVTETLLTSVSRKLTVTFGGALAGDEFALSSSVVNTVKISANPVHTIVGKTAGEPLFSVTRGYPGLAEEVQSRMFHGRIPAVAGATLASRAAEIFDFNIDGQNDAAARLDRIRSKTSETILAIKEGKYLIIITNKHPYFVNNREIKRNIPLNFVKTGKPGIRPNTKPVDMDNLIYYISFNGQQLMALAYEELSAPAYFVKTISILASHLISGAKRIITQNAEKDQDANKLWLLRDDGRLAVGQMIQEQDISGFCEWLVSRGGVVREIGVDADNRLWLTIQRGGDVSHELYDRSTLFQETVIRACDFAGWVSGLEFDGPVWARAEGYVLGPFTPEAGRINLGSFYDGDVEVGSWIAPVFETMRQPFVTGNDQIVFRPGTIHTAYLNLLSTTSLAVGANGEPVRDFPLSETTDAVNEAMPPKTKLVGLYAMLGQAEGPTLVITQTRPGELHVRDMALGMKL